MMRLEKQWQQFAAACFPPDISKQQRIDLRRTFYGGAVGLLAAIGEIPIDKMSTEDLLTEVQSELMNFNEDVKAGKS